MKIVKVILLILIMLVICIAVYWKLPGSPEKTKFQKAMQKKADETEKSSEVCSRQEIEQLPEPLKKYCEYIGLENFPKYQVVNVLFDDTDFVFDTKSGKIINMDYDLWLFYGDIYRTAFCSSSMYGIPFEGTDYVTDDRQGGMKGILAKKLVLFDTHDEQGYKASLISWLAESAVINPSVFLSPYVTYEEIDNTHIKATVTYQGVSGSGVFTFNDEGAITEFFSAERQVEEIDGVRMELGWKCYCDGYVEKNGIKTATSVKSTKIFPDGRELVYFAAKDYTVQYIK